MAAMAENDAPTVNLRQGPERAGPTDTDTDAELEPGARVGEYDLAERLGAGGFGTVYRAVHPVIGKQVAIKVLRREHVADEAMFARFVGEARAVNQICHPNIVDIFAFGMLPDGRHYFVMELLRGMSLGQLLAVRGPLPFAETVALLEPLAAALAATHSQGIIHRDLKADNVFLCAGPNGSVPKLLDFGIAKGRGLTASAPVTQDGRVVGTLGYMPPEQCMGDAVDARADVYAFGVLAYRMLSARLPFTGQAGPELVSNQLTRLPDPIENAPSHVDAALRWLLHKDVHQRCPDIHRAMSALAGGATGAALLRDAPTVDVGSGTSPARRPLRPAAAFGIAFLAALALGATVHWAMRPRPVEVRPTPPAQPTIEAAPAAAAQPQAEAPLELQVEGSPKGAAILAGDGRELGRVPATLELARSSLPVKLRFTSQGYVDQVRTITTETASPIVIVLARRKAKSFDPDSVEAPR